MTEQIDLSPSMTLLLRAAIELAPEASSIPLARQAVFLQTNHSFIPLKAEARFLRVIADGVDFGRWPVETVQ